MESHQEVLVSYLPSGKVSELFALQTAMFTSITPDMLSSATCKFCCRCFVAALEPFSLSFVAYKLDFNGAVKTLRCCCCLLEHRQSRFKVQRVRVAVYA